MSESEGRTFADRDEKGRTGRGRVSSWVRSTPATPTSRVLEDVPLASTSGSSASDEGAEVTEGATRVLFLILPSPRLLSLRPGAHLPVGVSVDFSL